MFCHAYESSAHTIDHLVDRPSAGGQSNALRGNATAMPQGGCQNGRFVSFLADSLPPRREACHSRYLLVWRSD